MTIDFPITLVREGKASFYIPDPNAFKGDSSVYVPSAAPVFYNPRMAENRDVAVLFLKIYSEMVGREVRVCEPMTGCGVRGLRFALEVEGLGEIIINDLNERAFELAEKNVAFNSLEDSITVRNMEASALLFQYAAPRRRFDYVDIDPFGSPAPFLESAIRALRNDSALAVTATDTAPLSGLYGNVCLRKYFGKSLRVAYWKEIAIRLLIGSVVWTASRFDIGVTPLISYAADHYLRVYLTTKYGAKAADHSIGKMGFILHCFQCLHRECKIGLQPFNSEKCPVCGSKMSYAGPLWLGHLIDSDFCGRMLKNIESMNLSCRRSVTKLLDLLRVEASAPPTYYVTDKFGIKLKCPLPPLKKVLDELKSMGFSSFRTHFHDRGFKTNAPIKIIQEIFRKEKS